MTDFIDENFKNGYTNVNHGLNNFLSLIISESDLAPLSSTITTNERGKQNYTIYQLRGDITHAENYNSNQNDELYHFYMNTFCNKNNNLSLHTIQNALLQEQDIYLKNKSSLQTNDVVFILLDNHKYNFGD